MRIVRAGIVRMPRGGRLGGPAAALKLLFCFQAWSQSFLCASRTPLEDDPLLRGFCVGLLSLPVPRYTDPQDFLQELRDRVAGSGPLWPKVQLSTRAGDGHHAVIIALKDLNAEGKMVPLLACVAFSQRGP